MKEGCAQSQVLRDEATEVCVCTKWCEEEGGCDEKPHGCSVQDNKDVVPPSEEPEEEEREGGSYTQQDRTDH